MKAYKRILWVMGITWVCLAADMAYAQVVYMPLRHPVYDYLDRLETKYGMQTIQFARPLPRIEIAKILADVYASPDLSWYDRRQIEFYFREFAEELQRLDLPEESAIPAADPRWHLAQVTWEGDVRNYFSADIIASGRYEIRQGDYLAAEGATTAAQNLLRISNGVTASGYVGSHLGASMTWYDNHVDGKPYDVRATRDPEQGIVKGPGSSATRYDYEVAEGQFTYSIPMFNIGIDKMDNWRGSGRFGAVVLSDHVPSFPKIGFNVKITDWLQFEYFHAWLFSDDLSSIRTVLPEGSYGQLKFYESKYLASHSISARPLKNLEVSLGESIIYAGGDVNVLFLIPVISFRAADRWTRATTGNSQFFADVRYSPVNGLMVYGTGYIDEMDLSKILGSDPINKDYQIAYTVGAQVSDVYTSVIPIANETRIEFSRTYPYAYSNPTVIQQYASHQVQMGHWIGANADFLSVEHTIHPYRFLAASLTGTYARFGDQTGPVPVPPRIQPAFLYSHEYSLASATGKLKWTPINGAEVWGTLTYTDISTEPHFRTAAIPDGISIGGGISYGIQ